MDEGQSWAEPDLDVAIQYMRNMRTVCQSRGAGEKAIAGGSSSKTIIRGKARPKQSWIVGTRLKIAPQAGLFEEGVNECRRNDVTFVLRIRRSSFDKTGPCAEMKPYFGVGPRPRDGRMSKFPPLSCDLTVPFVIDLRNAGTDRYAA
jgi:hypothetical protein